MTVKGVVKNGVVVLKKKLPEGTKVEVVVPKKKGLLNDELMKFVGKLSGPRDFARNHDHYIHGTPKK